MAPNTVLEIIIVWWMLTECNGLTYSFFPRALPVVDNLRVDLTLAVLFPTSDVTLMTIIHISVTQSYIVSSTPEQGSFLQLPYCVTGTNRKCFKTNTMELLPLFCSLSSLSLLKISHVFLWDAKNSVLISIFLPQAVNPEQQLLDSFLCLSFPSIASISRSGITGSFFILFQSLF